jgi:hypothetical protein
MSPLDLSSVPFPAVMELRDAAVYMRISEMRIRTLAREGALKGTKNAETGHWEFKKTDLDAFNATPRVRKAGSGPRGNGKSYVIVVPFEKTEAVTADLAKHGVKLQPRYNYEAQKAYRVKRNADLKAKKAAGGTAPSKTVVTPAPAKPAVAPAK